MPVSMWILFAFLIILISDKNVGRAGNKGYFILATVGLWLFVILAEIKWQ